MKTSTSIDSNSMSDINKIHNSGDQSIVGSHLIKLYSQLAKLEQQNDNPSTVESKPRHKTEEERINRRFDIETRSTQAYFAAKKSELKEHLLDRLRRKRKLVIDEMRTVIDINSRSLDVDPLFIALQTSHPLQTKAYNFRQRSDIGQQPSSIGEEEYLTQLGMLQQQTTRKRLVGAFNIFQLPKWTVKDEECEDDLKMISINRK
ncbi:unnamed protein product [Rotaria magnacalcarata]